MVSSLAGTGILLSAAVASPSAKPPLVEPYDAIAHLWNNFPISKKLTAHQIIRGTPLHSFPPGLVPLILSYVAQAPRTFSLTAQDILLTHVKNNSLLGWLGTCPRPFLALRLIRPEAGDPLSTGFLEVYWCSRPGKHYCLKLCRSFALKITKQGTISTHISHQSQVEIPATVIQQAHAISSTHEPPTPESSDIFWQGIESVRDTEMVLSQQYRLNVHIVDFDEALKSGTSIAGFTYDETASALTYACSHRLARQEFEALEAKASEESKQGAAAQNKPVQHKNFSLLKYIASKIVRK